MAKSLLLLLEQPSEHSPHLQSVSCGLRRFGFAELNRVIAAGCLNIDRVFILAFGCLQEQMPGFAILAVFLAFTGRSEMQSGISFSDHGVRDNEPVIGGNDIESEEVDGSLGVAAIPGSSNVEAVAALGVAAHGAFHLNAEDWTGGFEAYIIAGEASVGAGNLEPLARGQRHEVEFGPSTTLFGVFDAAA